jgi:hypothetical protein
VSDQLGDKSEVKGGYIGRDSSAGIATSYSLDSSGSISRYFQFFIGTIFLYNTYFLMY